MALFALYQATDGTVTRDEVNDAIAGNLCRCTGYRPIVDAGDRRVRRPRKDRFRTGAGDMSGVLTFLADGEDVFVGDDERFFAAPSSIDSLAALYEKHPDATIVAGGTDVGLWITKQLRDIAKIIHVGKVATFDKIEDTGHELIIGAGATYAQVEPYLARIDPDLGELLRRLGSRQVRARHGRRQRRQRLADRRHAAGADRPRRQGRAAQGAAGALHAGRGILHRVRQAEARAGRTGDGNHRAAARPPATSSAATR